MAPQHNRSARRTFRRALLLFPAAIAIAACQPSTRISGSIRLASGLAAPDSDLHTLYVAAFATTATSGSGGSMAVNCTANTPIWVEFGAVRNADFNPTVDYELGGAGSAREANVFAWWRVGSASQETFSCARAGDVFGAAASNPVFAGKNGTGGGDQAQHVDLTLDRTL